MAQSINAGMRQPDAGALAKWVTFGVGQELYGIPVLQVQEVLKVPEIAEVPGLPAMSSASSTCAAMWSRCWTCAAGCASPNAPTTTRPGSSWWKREKMSPASWSTGSRR